MNPSSTSNDLLRRQHKHLCFPTAQGYLSPRKSVFSTCSVSQDVTVTPEDACPVWGSNLQWKLSITSVFVKLEHFARFKENKSRKDLGEIRSNGTVKMWSQGCDWFCLSRFPWQPLYSNPGQSTNLDNYIFWAKFLPSVSVGWEFSFFLIWTTCRVKLSSVKQLLHFIPGRLPLMDLAVWHWGLLN